MNDNCRPMRERIERSIGCPMESAELEKLELHCAACDSCRAYRERLIEDDARLAELAAPRAESIERVRARAIERVRAADRAPGGRVSAVIARIPRIAGVAAAAAAAVIVAFVAIDLIRGAQNGPVPAFAAVQEKMQNADNVVYRVRLWSMGQWNTYTSASARPRMRRRDYGDSTVVSDIRSGGGVHSVAELRLYPAERRAVIYKETREDSCSKCSEKKRPDAVDVLTGWFKQKGFAFVRKERYEGKRTAVYEKRSSATHRVTAWVDLETELLARLEVVSPRRGPNDNPHFHHLRLRDFLPSDSKAAGWIELKTDEPCMILDDFRWNEIRDTSYFSTVPPAGYSVEIEEPADPDELSGYRHANGIAKALSGWLDLSGNTFPDRIHDLRDSTKVKPLLLARFRRGVDPVEEFRAAYRYADLMEMNSTIIWILEDMLKTPIYYSGKGAVFGDSKRAICWIKVNDEPYHVIYADLHVAASQTQPRLVGE